jgi:hypothetical protein
MIDGMVTETRDMLALYVDFDLVNEIDEAERHVERVRELNKIDAASHVKLNRQKRQATSSNCTALQIQLANAQNQISLLENKIQNDTILLNTLVNQTIIYQAKVNNSTGNSKKINENLLTVYSRLVLSTNSSLEKTKIDLANWKAIKTQLQNQIQIYCLQSTTTARPFVKSPCG